MKKNNISFCRKKEWLPLAAALSLISLDAYATENGGSIYPMGAENYMTAALPPAGLYGMVFINHYEADQLKNNSGDTVPVDFNVRANAVSPRLVWVTGQKVLGGDLGFHVIAPLVDLKVGIAGNSQSKQGLGDITFGGVLGYHHSDNLHSIAALDIYAPTGRYEKGDLANIGRNYWAVQPVLGVSYVDPKGLNADIKAMYTYNLENKDTHYKSGQEFHFDYDLGWGLGNGLVAGVGGYAYWQTTDDKANGQTDPNNRGRAFAIGPSIKYDSGKGWFVTAKWQKEMNVRNRPEGDAFWLKAVFPM